MPEHAPADSTALPHFDGAITIVEAETRFRAAELPRHPKSIERYCRSGSLRCIKEHGANGLQYLIDPTSVDELIVFLKQAHSVGNKHPHAPAGSDLIHTQTERIEEEQNGRVSPQAPARSDRFSQENETEQTGASSDTFRFVQQLEKRIDEKDGEIGFLRTEVAMKNEQIKDLTERARETNHLIAGLQRMLSPLLGRGEQSERGAPMGGSELP